ncbi:PQQ-binding-like beta-propeller repeat protein, partial [Myxococcota bacterium]|nr:PQQ-binding-like beta-propeller repeat protein [Myxococcota bacterium]
GVFIDEARCWLGNEDGQIFALNHEGVVERQYKLPDGVKCIVDDGEWLYAGCDDGKVYDLNTKIPMAAYEIADNIDIFWLDIRDGVLGISDRQGNVMTVNHEEESQWTRRSPGVSGWMVRCDEIGVYHGHSNGITMYDWEDGAVIWQNQAARGVLFGWQEETTLYAGCADGNIYQIDKRGALGKTYRVGAPVFSCAAAEDGRWVFGGDNRSTIYCFDAEGRRIWEMSTGCGSAFSMQYHQDKLYVVTTHGTLACIDVSEAAITRAKAGGKTQARSIQAPPPSAAVPVGARLPETREAGAGVIIECLMIGGKLRARARGEGFNPEWNVQFPRELRQAGARFVVERLKEADRGGFYRVFGEIKRLI